VLPLERTYGRKALGAALQLRRMIANERIVLTQTFFETSDLWAGPLAKLSGCPVLVSSRRDLGFRRTLKHRIAYRMLAPIFDSVHAVSDAVRNISLHRDGINSGKIVTIPNGVDIQAATRSYPTDLLRKRLGIEDGSRLIADVTTIRRVKGLDILARTAAIVCRKYPNAVFLVVGHVADRQYMAELDQLVDSLGIRSNFRFVGGVEAPFDILQMSHIFCHLSRTDGLSNALLEAMAAGLPCVVSRAGGNGDVVEEGASGFVVPIEHPELAADRVMTLLRYPDCAGRLGERARSLAAQNFSSHAMAARFVELYDDLLSRHEDRRSSY
jgi:glycosyltransferase involved in cell wall biosynthesis